MRLVSPLVIAAALGVSWVGGLSATDEARGATVQETAADYQGAAAEEFLRKARMTAIKDLGTGITLPQKATLELNGVTRSAVFKTIDESKMGITTFASGGGETAFQDSWQLEIPAYIVDVIVGLGMVPATIERSLAGKTGSLQWWVESMMPEAERAKKKVSPPDTEAWERVVLKMRLFDQLIYNTDRHANNILITKDFDLRLIDHSRAFRPFRNLKDPAVLTRFSKSLLAGIEKLEYADVKKRVGRWLRDDQIRGLMSRRDAILELARKAVAERGEAAVIYP
jgi:hypothetical protein